MNIQVVNYRSGAQGVNIMRGKSILSNKFRIGRDGTRADVIAKYRIWLWAQMNIPGSALMDELRTLLHTARYNTLVLMCCCKPLPCHGDVVKAALELLSKQPN